MGAWHARSRRDSGFEWIGGRSGEDTARAVREDIDAACRVSWRSLSPVCLPPSFHSRCIRWFGSLRFKKTPKLAKHRHDILSGLQRCPHAEIELPPWKLFTHLRISCSASRTTSKSEQRGQRSSEPFAHGDALIFSSTSNGRFSYQTKTQKLGLTPAHKQPRQSSEWQRQLPFAVADSVGCRNGQFLPYLLHPSSFRNSRFICREQSWEQGHRLWPWLQLHPSIFSEV